MKEDYLIEMREDDEGFIRKAWPELTVLKMMNVGDYQGTIYVVGYVDGKVLATGYGYGSCSGCGAWGEGGEPTSPKDLIDAGVYGKTLEETLEWLKKEPENHYQALNAQNKASLAQEIRRAFTLVEKETAP